MSEQPPVPAPGPVPPPAWSAPGPAPTSPPWSAPSAPDGYGPPTGYGPPPGYYGYAPPQQGAGTNGFSIASLVLGLVGLLFFWLLAIPNILAIIFAAKAKRQIRANGQGGAGMAVAGLILGILGLVFGVLFMVASVKRGLDCANSGVTPC